MLGVVLIPPILQEDTDIEILGTSPMKEPKASAGYYDWRIFAARAVAVAFRLTLAEPYEESQVTLERCHTVSRNPRHHREGKVEKELREEDLFF